MTDLNSENEKQPCSGELLASKQGSRRSNHLSPSTRNIGCTQDEIHCYTGSWSQQRLAFSSSLPGSWTNVRPGTVAFKNSNQHSLDSLQSSVRRRWLMPLVSYAFLYREQKWGFSWLKSSCWRNRTTRHRKWPLCLISESIGSVVCTCRYCK